MQLITIDYKSNLPINDQIVNGITRLCALDVLKPHDKLPSVRNFALDLGVNPNTVQRAYSILEQKGIIYSVSGKGSFISEGAGIIVSLKNNAKEDFKRALKETLDVGISKEELLNIMNEFFENGGNE